MPEITNANFVMFFEESYGGIYTYLNNNCDHTSLIISSKYFSGSSFCGNLKVVSFFSLECFSLLFNDSVALNLHGLFSPLFLIYFFMLRILQPNAKINVYPHGALYPSVLSSSRKFEKRLWLKIFEMFLIEGSEFICLSSDEEMNLLRIFKRARCSIQKTSYKPVVSSSMFFNLQTRKSFLAIRNFVILARYSPEKQIYETISSFNKVDLPFIRLKVYGSIAFNPLYFSKCASLVSELKDSRVHLYDFASGTELSNVLFDCYCGIVYSQKENFSFSLIDFVSSSSLVISNDNVGATSLFSGNSLFVLEHTNTYGLLAEVISRVALLPSNEFKSYTSSAYSEFLNFQK